jgi:hypothetical protein
MPFRVKASAIAVSVAICTLLAPAAVASAGVSHAPVQVTGKKLKSGLLPPTRFQPSYSTIFASNSGGRLEHGAVFHIPSMKCVNFWNFIGTVKGFGETAFATESAIAGPNVYLIDSTLLNVQSPKPALSSLMLKLIARVRALR